MAFKDAALFGRSWRPVIQMAKKEKLKNTGGRIAANFRDANVAEGVSVQMLRPFASILYSELVCPADLHC